MARTISVTETIDRSPGEVWEVLTDWPGGVRWMNGIESMSIEGETVEGAHVRFHTRGQDRDSVITHCDPGRSITLRSQQGGVTADYTYSIEALGGIEQSRQPGGGVPLQRIAVSAVGAADPLRDSADGWRPDCGFEAGDRRGTGISAA